MPRKKKDAKKLIVEKIPLANKVEPPTIPVFEPMPILYLELFENKNKVKHHMRNEAYIPKEQDEINQAMDEIQAEISEFNGQEDIGDRKPSNFNFEPPKVEERSSSPVRPSSPTMPTSPKALKEHVDDGYRSDDSTFSYAPLVPPKPVSSFFTSSKDKDEDAQDTKKKSNEKLKYEPISPNKSKYHLSDSDESRKSTPAKKDSPKKSSGSKYSGSNNFQQNFRATQSTKYNDFTTDESGDEREPVQKTKRLQDDISVRKKQHDIAEKLRDKNPGLTDYERDLRKVLLGHQQAEKPVEKVIEKPVVQTETEPEDDYVPAKLPSIPIPQMVRPKPQMPPVLTDALSGNAPPPINYNNQNASSATTNHPSNNPSSTQPQIIITDSPYTKDNAELQAKRDMLFKFDILKKKYKNVRINEYDEYSDLDTMKNEYDKIVKQVYLDSCVETYTQYLIIGFWVIEFSLTKFLGFSEMAGFTQEQLVNMNKYERLLIEIGEKQTLELHRQWSPELRLVGTILLSSVTFIGARMVKKAASNLFGGGGGNSNPKQQGAAEAFGTFFDAASSKPAPQPTSQGAKSGATKRRMNRPVMDDFDVDKSD